MGSHGWFFRKNAKGLAWFMQSRFRSCQHYMGEVGHTHGPLDQRYSVVASALAPVQCAPVPTGEHSVLYIYIYIHITYLKWFVYFNFNICNYKYNYLFIDSTDVVFGMQKGVEDIYQMF